MPEKKQTDKKRRSSTKSSGERRGKQAKRNIHRTKMKIKRFERYANEIQTGFRKKNPNDKRKHTKFDTSRWDTSGLKAYIQRMEEVVAMGLNI